MLTKTFLYVLGRIVPALIGLGGVALYTRLLDAASVGTYTLLLATSLLVSGIATSWVRVAAFRLLAGSAEPNPVLVRTIAQAFAVLSLVMVVAEIPVLVAYHQHFSAAAFALALAIAVAASFYDLTIALIQAQLDVGRYGALSLARAIVAVSCSLLLIHFGLHAEALLGGFLAANLVAAGGLRYWLPAIHGRFDRDRFREMLHFGWPMSLTYGCAQAPATFSRYLLTVLAGSAAAGIFGVAGDFARQTIVLLMGATSLAGQQLAIRRYDTEGAEAARRALIDNIMLIAAVGVPATVGIAVFATPMAHVFLGRGFQAQAGTIIALTAVTTLLVGLRTFYFDQAFELVKDTRPQIVLGPAVCVLEIGSAALLIPIAGAAGAVLASVVAATIGLASSALWGRRFFALPLPLADFAKIALATGAMLVIVRLLPPASTPLGLSEAIAAAMIVYVATFGASSYRRLRGRLADGAQ